MSQFIPLSEAKQMITNYREIRPTILVENVPENTLPFCETFESSQVQELLEQNDCQKLRVYFSMDEANEIRLLLVGVDEKDQDILTSSEELILEKGNRCPEICPPSSELNP